MTDAREHVPYPCWCGAKSLHERHPLPVKITAVLHLAVGDVVDCNGVISAVTKATPQPHGVVTYELQPLTRPAERIYRNG